MTGSRRSSPATSTPRAGSVERARDGALTRVDAAGAAIALPSNAGAVSTVNEWLVLKTIANHFARGYRDNGAAAVTLGRATRTLTGTDAVASITPLPGFGHRRRPDGTHGR